ncbi:MAG: hypothetical protein IH881_16335 [Myxococcales bacterium]|nr:hypothetical protein [Myxococcales bacterium]
MDWRTGFWRLAMAVWVAFTVLAAIELDWSDALDKLTGEPIYGRGNEARVTQIATRYALLSAAIWGAFYSGDWIVRGFRGDKGPIITRTGLYGIAITLCGVGMFVLDESLAGLSFIGFLGFVTALLASRDRKQAKQKKRISDK